MEGAGNEHGDERTRGQMEIEFRWGTNEGRKIQGKQGQAHWSSPNDGATNESGFTALPGGRRNDIWAYSNMRVSLQFFGVLLTTQPCSPGAVFCISIVKLFIVTTIVRATECRFAA